MWLKERPWRRYAFAKGFVTLFRLSARPGLNAPRPFRTESQLGSPCCSLDPIHGPKGSSPASEPPTPPTAASDGGSHPAPQLLPSNHMSSTRPLIAVVDDDQGMRTALRRLLCAANFDVETFPSGPEFLNSLQARQPDCVILDMDMPQLDGLAVQERLTQAGIRLPFVVVTGRDSDATRLRALAAGASAYLAKPVDGHTLLDAIAAATSQPPAPTGNPENPAVNPHHPKPVKYADRQPGHNG